MEKTFIRFAIPVGVVLSVQGFHALRSHGFGIEAAQAVCGAIKTAPFRKVVLQRSFPQLKDMPAGRVEGIAENSMKAELKKCPVVISAVGERMDLNF